MLKLRSVVEAAYNRGVLKYGTHEAAIDSVTNELTALLKDGETFHEATLPDPAVTSTPTRWCIASAAVSSTVGKLLGRAKSSV